ncbi:MAG: VCBS repeat-containing protein [Bacteroidetes bacterium]|nr:VCBS repeat-containing protein [Bacteroidota bacterium]
MLLLLIAFCSCRKESPFRKTIITTDFVSEAVATGDVNHDGKKDILAGTSWYEAPDWKRHEIMSGPYAFNPDKDYSHSFASAAADVNHDGWIDWLNVDFPGTTASWFENPGQRTEPWKQHVIFPTLSNESPAFVDLDGDGNLDLVGADSVARQIIWMKGPSGNEMEWKKFAVSDTNAPGTEVFSHGLGVGDVNQDGRKDILVTRGWWEGPLSYTDVSWKFHAADLGDPCAQMYTMDVNGDGLQDVISSSAHLSGIWWHEQIQGGEPGWENHVLSYAFSESHALAMADLNGDGFADMITGKRSLKRNTWRKNPGTHGAPLLFWFEYTTSEPYWTPHQIDDASGAGLNITIDDMNGDGKPDIVIANFKGVFLFENHLTGQKKL